MDKMMTSAFMQVMSVPTHLIRGVCSLIRELFENPVCLWSIPLRCFCLWRWQGSKVLARTVFLRLINQRKLKNIEPGMIDRFLKVFGRSKPDAESWFLNYRPNERILSQLRKTTWPDNAPFFSVILCSQNNNMERVSEAIDSVRKQSYQNWELICVNNNPDSSQLKQKLETATAEDDRITVSQELSIGKISKFTQQSTERIQGDYVCFLNADDSLEPHALHRIAKAILRNRPDMIYCDEVIVGSSLNDIKNIILRPGFNYDYYLSHRYFESLLAVRKGLLINVSRPGLTHLDISDVDLIFHLLEQGETVCHVPDILYRRRIATKKVTDTDSNNHSFRESIEQHLKRLQITAHVRNVSPNYFDVSFQSEAANKVAIIIPTHNQPRMLNECVTSLSQTVPNELAEIYVIDHQPKQKSSSRCELQSNLPHYVLPYNGSFNFSKMMNFAVGQLHREYSHYLFLNDDTRALHDGWLEHMLGLSARNDVGIVGATLQYPDDTLQHAGAVIGNGFGIGHVHRCKNLYSGDGSRNSGYYGDLMSNRECSAVTGACLLIRSDVFEEVDGFDESFSVGYGDIDLCLRVGKNDRKVLVDAHAILLHHESFSRGSRSFESHPRDSLLFGNRYKKLLQKCDWFSNPLLDRATTDMEHDPGAVWQHEIEFRTSQIKLPKNQNKNLTVSPADKVEQQFVVGRAA